MKKFIRTEINLRDLSLNDDLEIIEDIVGRLVADTAFKSRHRAVGKIATLTKKLGVFGVIRWIPNRVPHMSLTA